MTLDVDARTSSGRENESRGENAQPSHRRRRFVNLKRAALWVLAASCAVLIFAIAAVTWLLTTDFTSWVEDYASKAIERHVSIGTMRIGWGNPLSLELTDLKVANAPWGSTVDMISIDRVSALIDPWSIFGATLRFHKLQAVRPIIVLERDKDGVGNWKFKGPVSSRPVGFATVPKNRMQFPTLLDFSMQDGMVSYKGVGSYRLRIDLQSATIQSAGDGEPVTLTAEGAYNGTPVKLSAKTDSFGVLRDDSRPFGMVLSMTAAAANLDFSGTVTDPLNFDGVAGTIKIDAVKLGDLLKFLNVDIGINPPMLLVAGFRRAGDHWQMENAKGKLATSAFDGDLAVDEGPRERPDNVSATLRFGELDLNPLLPSTGEAASGRATDLNSVSLRLDPNPAANVDAGIDAGQLAFGKTHIAGFNLHVKLAAGSVAVSQLDLNFASGKIQASGRATTTTRGTQIVARGNLSNADGAQLARLVDALAGKLSGEVDGALDMDMTGDTLGNALRVGRGHAVLSVARGSVSRDLMEKLSTNMRNLIGAGEGSVHVSCMLGVADFQNGVAAIPLIRLKSDTGTLIGGGKVDVLGSRLDVTVQSESASTEFFALDIPIRISGRFANPSIEPQLSLDSNSRQALINGNPTRGLSPDLLGMARRNACLH